MTPGLAALMRMPLPFKSTTSRRQVHLVAAAGRAADEALDDPNDPEARSRKFCSQLAAFNAGNCAVASWSLLETRA